MKPQQKLASVSSFAPAKPWFERGSEDLMPEHQRYLADRGIKRSYWKLANYRSEPDGLVIPYPDLDGGFEPDFGRKRFLPARGDQKFIQAAGQLPRLYFAPLAGTKLDWPTVCADPSIEVFLIEGELHTAAVAQFGVPAIGLGGVWNWSHKANGISTLIPDFDLVEWRGRSVVVAFDADVATKRNVQLAIVRLGAALGARLNGKVQIALIPDLGDGKSGVDDFVAARGIGAFKELSRHSLDDPDFRDWCLHADPEDANFTDAGNALRFVDLHGEATRYAPEWRKFLLWDNTRWRRDEAEQVIQMALEVARSMFRQAAKCEDADRRKAIGGAALALESSKRLEAMLRIARTYPDIAITVTNLDAHPFFLGVADGVLDLKTGKRIEPMPEWLMTKQSPVTFDAAARCPAFEKFLLEIMNGHDELVAYLQRVIGYLLTGDCREQAFFIWHGIGANGKSTLLVVLQSLLGEYATTSRMETWTNQKRNAGGPSEDVARLHGIRMVCAVESEEDQRLAESLIKELTGQDKVAARRLYENSFEFVPQFKLILVCNHRPIVRGDDPAIWRRLRLIPFERTFSPDQQEKGLIERLKSELPGILNWAIQGCLEWQRTGLAEPEIVNRATNQYRADSDLLREFIAECCETGEKHSAPTMRLYSAFRQWADDRGHRPMTMTTFSRKLQDRGFEKKFKTKARVSTLIGLQLRPDGRDF